MGRKLLMILAPIVACLAAYSVVVLLSARSNAEVIANGNPYCIQIATSTAYKEINNPFDLAGFRMKGRGPLNHAVLVIGNMENPRLYHWSYLSNSFKEGAYGDPPIFCKPQKNFIGLLGGRELKGEIRFSFSYAGYRFSIPKEYHPRFNIPSFAGIKILTLSATAPKFEPVLNPGYKKAPNVGLTVGFGRSPLLQSWKLLPYASNSAYSLR